MKFKIIGADGREYGPVSADQLKAWIADGRVNAQTKVLPEDALEWKTVAEVPELAALLPPPPLTVPPIASASPLPADVEERDYEIGIGDCFQRAWKLVTGPKAMLVIGGLAIWLAIQGGLSMMGQIPLLGLLFTLASLVISGPLTAGVYYFLLRNIRGGAADVGDVFAGFKDCFGQLFLGYIMTALLTVATALPGMVPFIFGAVLVSQSHAEALGIGLMVGGGIVMLIPVIYVSIGWMFTLPLILDKRLEFWPAMKLSRKVVGKHWWTVFALSLVVALICLLGLPFCCIGIFFTVPLGMATATYAYEKMFSARADAAPISPVLPQNQP